MRYINPCYFLTYLVNTAVVNKESTSRLTSIQKADQNPLTKTVNTRVLASCQYSSWH